MKRSLATLLSLSVSVILLSLVTNACQVPVETSDAGAPDAGGLDAAVADAGEHAADAGAVDAGVADGGMDAGAPDAGGMDGSVAQTCAAPSECPLPVNECLSRVCLGGLCGTAETAPHAACDGGVCNGHSVCVGCLTVNDCAQPATTCLVAACTAANVCDTSPAARGTACTDHGGVVCDGTGSCVATHCMDGVKDADETDVDCGGSCGATCRDTGPQQHCRVGGDCVNGVCSGSPLLCQAPSCSDGVKNATETDVDCGGPTCDATGQKCGVSKVCVSAADCTSGYCSPAHVCALFPDGQVCTSNGQCANGNCVGGVCCNTTCTGTCQACTTALTGQPSGTCASLTAGSSAPAGQCVASPPCGNDGHCAAGGTCAQAAATVTCLAPSCSNGLLTPAATCSGTGTCGSATASACPGRFVCASSTACATACAADSDCANPTDFCQSPGPTGTCVPRHANGGACLGDTQCANGHCVGNICCATTCSGTCMACGLAFTGQADGTCAPVHAGSFPVNLLQCAAGPTCGNTGVCAAGGSCQQAPPTTNCAPAACVGNQYTAAASCDGVGACPAQVTTTCAGGFVCGATTCKTSCAADSDCAAVGDYCLNPGASGTCVARRSAGAVCTANNQCAGGNCAGGVCCSSACNGTCQACTLAFTGQPDGTCASVLPGHLPADPNQCVAAAPCGKTGVCAAGGSCQVVAAGVAVANPVAGDCHSDFCNGAGQTTVNGVDDTDVPVDGNACTLDVCTQGAPTNPPAPAGTSCSVGGNTVCNGAGACGACVPGDSRYCCGVKTSACCLGPGSPNEGKAVSTPGLTCCCGTAQDCDPSGQWGACY